jgi:hypothetical protein
MVHSRFHTPQVLKFATMLSAARTPQELAFIQSRLSTNLYGISAIVSLATHESGKFMYLPFSFPSSLYQGKILSYFRHRYFYIIHHALIQLPRLAIDYTITFDTNSASYVCSIVKNLSLDKLRPEVKSTFHNILVNNLNFDAFFYFIENIKIAIPIIQSIRKSERDTPLKFWKLLDREFRWNIVCLKLFQNVDCNYYRDNGKFKFAISFIKAVRLSVDFAYSFYAHYENRHLVNELLQYHRLTLLQLLEFNFLQKRVQGINLICF